MVFYGGYDNIDIEYDVIPTREYQYWYFKMDNTSYSMSQ